MIMPNQDVDCDGVLTVDDCDSNMTMPNQDGDCDGVLTVDDCDDSNMTMPNQDGDCDGVLKSRIVTIMIQQCYQTQTMEIVTA